MLKVSKFCHLLTAGDTIYFVKCALSERSGGVLRCVPRLIFRIHLANFSWKWPRSTALITVSGTKIHPWIINVVTEWWSAVVKAVHLDSDLTINISTAYANGLLITILACSTLAVEVDVLLSPLFFQVWQPRQLCAVQYVKLWFAPLLSHATAAPVWNAP